MMILKLAAIFFQDGRRKCIFDIQTAINRKRQCYKKKLSITIFYICTVHACKLVSSGCTISIAFIFRL